MINFTKCKGIPHWIPESLLKYYSAHNTKENKKQHIQNNLKLYDLEQKIIIDGSHSSSGQFAEKEYNPCELEEVFSKIEAEYGVISKKIAMIVKTNGEDYSKTNNEVFNLLFSEKFISKFLQFSLINYLRNKKSFNAFKQHCLNLNSFKEEDIYNYYWCFVYNILKDNDFNRSLLLEMINRFRNLYHLGGENVIFLPDLPIIILDNDDELLNIINIFIKKESIIAIKRIYFYLSPSVFILFQQDREIFEYQDILNDCFREAMCFSDKYLILSQNEKILNTYMTELPIMSNKRVKKDFIFDFNEHELFACINRINN